MAVGRKVTDSTYEPDGSEGNGRGMVLVFQIFLHNLFGHIYELPCLELYPALLTSRTERSLEVTMAKKSLAPLNQKDMIEMHDIFRVTGLSEFIQINFASAEGSIAFEQVKEVVIENDDGGIMFHELDFYIPNEELATILCLKNQDLKFNATNEELVVPAEILSEVLNTKQSRDDRSMITLVDVKDANLKKWIVKIQERMFMKTTPSQIPRRELYILLTIRKKPEQFLGWWKYCVRRARHCTHTKKKGQLVENANIVYAYILANSRAVIETDASGARVVVSSAERTFRFSKEVRERVRQVVPNCFGTIPTESEVETEEINEIDEIDFPAEGAAELKEEWITELTREPEPGREHPMRLFILERKRALVHVYDYYKREVAKSQSLGIQLGIISKQWSDSNVDELKIQKQQLADKLKTLKDEFARIDQREKANAVLVHQKRSELLNNEKLVAKLQDDLAAEQGKVQNTNKELAQQKNAFLTVQSQVQKAKEQLKVVTQERDAAVMEKEKKAAKDQQELSILTRQLEEIRLKSAAFSTMRSQVQKAEEQLKVVTQERDAAVMEKEKKAAKDQQELSILTRQLEDIRLKSAAFSTMRSQVQKAEEQLKVVTQERDAAVIEKEKKAAECQQQLLTLTRQVEEIQMKSAFDVEENKKLNEQITCLKSHLEVTDYNKLVGSVETRRHLFSNSTTKRRLETMPQVPVPTADKVKVFAKVTAEVTAGLVNQFKEQEDRYEELKVKNLRQKQLLTTIGDQLKHYLEHSLKVFFATDIEAEWIFRVNAMCVNMLRISLGFTDSVIGEKEFIALWDEMPRISRGFIPRILWEGRLRVRNSELCNIISGGLHNLHFVNLLEVQQWVINNQVSIPINPLVLEGKGIEKSDKIELRCLEERAKMLHIYKGMSRELQKCLAKAKLAEVIKIREPSRRRIEAVLDLVALGGWESENPRYTPLSQAPMPIWAINFSSPLPHEYEEEEPADSLVQ